MCCKLSMALLLKSSALFRLSSATLLPCNPKNATVVISWRPQHKMAEYPNTVRAKPTNNRCNHQSAAQITPNYIHELNKEMSP
jgi:hypothetical protein